MGLITDTSLCDILGFDLDNELSMVRRHAKTAIKNIKAQIQDALDALGGESLEALEDIADKIDEEVNGIIESIAEDPFVTAAGAILSCIGTNLTLFDFSLNLSQWRELLDKWILNFLDSYLSPYEKLLWSYLDELESALSPYMLDKIMAFAACLADCPGVAGASTPGPDGWGYVTPQGWVFIDQSDFTDLVNTIGLGIDGKVDFSLFGASGSTYGTRVRTIQDKKNNSVNALAALATGTMVPDDDSQDVLDTYDTLVESLDDAYENYLGINSDIVELISLSNDYIKEVDIYLNIIYKLGSRVYRDVADSGKSKMLTIYSNINSYYTSAIANNSTALAAYNDLDLITLNSLITTNTGYLNSSKSDKNRIKLLNSIVKDMSNALENKGTIGATYSGGVKVRGRAAIKEATGVDSYQEEINAV